MLASFFLARATLAFSAEQGEMRAQRWLIYPPLIVVYVFLGLLVLLAPLPLAPVWFIILGALLRRVPGFFATVFAPFLGRERARRVGKWLIWIGVILVGLAIIGGAIVLIVSAVLGLGFGRI
jgi:hypothetical protein